MELVIEEAKTMKQVVDALLVSHNEVRINITNEKFVAQSQGTSMISSIELYKSFFKTYDLDQQLTLHVDLLNFANFIKLAKNNDSLTIKHNLESNQIEMTLASDVMTRKSSLALISDDSEYISDSSQNKGNAFKFRPVIQMEFATSTILDASLILDAMKTMTFAEGEVLVTHDKSGLNFKANNRNQVKSAQAYIKFNNEMATDVKIQSGEFEYKKGRFTTLPETHEALYKLEHLSDMTKNYKSGEKIHFGMMHKGPVRFLTTLSDDKGKIAQVLTPLD